MTEICDLCAGGALTAVYAPTPSPRGLTVYCCGNCGLVQSLPRLDRDPHPRIGRVSAGADWGNIRYGKGFRADANMASLRPFLPMGAELKVLDAGANRGAFALKLAQEFPAAHVTAVEPDATVTVDWASHPRFTLLPSRIEEAHLSASNFDLVYSCHTLEHLRGPRQTLLDHWRVLKPGGLLFLETPNLEIAGGGDIVEEFFIDKHLFHYTPRTLARTVESAGFEIVAGPSPEDHVNVTLVARKSQRNTAAAEADPVEVERAIRLILDYRANRGANLTALAKVAAQLMARKDERIAIWGAGRILHCLIEHGGLNPAAMAAVVDANLSKHLSEVHGVPLHAPDALTNLNPGMVVVMSRSFADEIAAQARYYAPNAEIVAYSGLLAEAKRA